MNNLPLFIALRYLRGAQHEKNSATMVRICFLSIFIGTFALALVAAIMNGFEKATCTKMQGIHAHVIIRAHGDHLNLAAINDVCHTIPGIASWAPSDTRQVLVQADHETSPEVMVLKGIDPVKEATTTTLQEKLIAGPRTLTQAINNNGVLLGWRAAQTLGASPGDTITLLFTPNEITGRKINLASYEVTVGGIFKTGLEEFDASTLFCSLDFLAQLFPDAGATCIGIQLHRDADEQVVIDHLHNYLGEAEVSSWKSLYVPLISALKLEKYVMFLILALITLVASMNIISLLFMQITQKRGDIALLQALGCSTKRIISIFLYMGMLIAFIAAVLGLIGATAACWFLERYPCIELPDVYYVSHVPAHMEFSILITVFALVMLLSFLATYVPAQRIKSMNIANVLRFEG